MASYEGRGARRAAARWPRLRAGSPRSNAIWHPENWRWSPQAAALFGLDPQRQRRRLQLGVGRSSPMTC